MTDAHPHFSLSRAVEDRILRAGSRATGGELSLHLGEVVVDGQQLGPALTLCTYPKGTFADEDFQWVSGIKIAISPTVMNFIDGNQLVIEQRQLGDGNNTDMIWIQKA